MAAFYVPLPAYRPGGQIDFSPLNEGLDALGRTVEKNRLLSEAKQIGEAMRSGATTDASGATVPNPQVNRLLERIYPSEGAPSPAQASAAAAGRGFPATSPGGSSLPAANGNMSQYARSIANIESGGDYGVRGPVTRSGDRAYGKYQVMGANVGPWTQQILGRAMTPDEFLADPQAQEKVFEAKFGEYVNRTGSPQDAASMWFTGRPAAEGANRRARDVNGRPLGITGQEYVNQFNSGIGQSGQPMAQTASAQPRPAGINYAAGIDAALKQGNIPLAQQLIEQQRLSENAPLQTERMTQDVQKGRAELERAAEVRLATLANTIQSATPETQSAMWQRLLQTHPEMAAQLQAYGVDPRDVKSGTDFFINQVRGLPSAKEIKSFKEDEGLYVPGGPGGVTVLREPGVKQDTKNEAAKFEQSLRKEYTSLTADMRTINDSYSRLQASSKLDSGPADIAMVYSYMKILDPTSVVREGEYATAEQTAGLPEQIVGTYNKLMSGQRLTPQQRSQFVDAAANLVKDKNVRLDMLRRQFGNIATNAGVSPERVMLDEGAATDGSVPPPDQKVTLAPRPQGATDEQIIREANQAIRDGTDPAAVRQQLEAWGIRF
jgi:hypothetical protein